MLAPESPKRVTRARKSLCLRRVPKTETLRRMKRVTRARKSGERELSIEAINTVAKYFGMTIDQLVNFDGNIPDDVTVEDKSLMEQVKLIAELEPEEKNMVFKMIDTFLTKKKFKDFFAKNIAAL